MINEEEIQDIYRRKKQKILKWGTYVIDNQDKNSKDNISPEMGNGNSTIMESGGGELDMDEATRAAYEAIMPTRMEDSIQSNINAIMQEQNSNKENELSELPEDELVAEIMKKFQNNIQDNVNELFK